VGTIAISQRRVDHKLSIDAGDTYFRDGALERDIRDRQCGRCGKGCECIRKSSFITRNQVKHDLRFRVVVVREQGAYSPVNEATDKSFVIGKAAFTFEESPGYLSGSSEFFLIVDRKRKE